MDIYKARTDDGKFEFEFELNQKNNISHITVNTKIYYLDRNSGSIGKLKFEKNDSKPNELIDFDIIDCGDYLLRGYVVLKIVKANDGTFAAINSYFHYGEKETPIEFEGLILYTPISSIPVPPIPPEPPVPPIPPIPVGESSKNETISIQVNLENDLFPYVYMRKWPGISKEDLLNNFVKYLKYPLKPDDKLLIDALIKDSGDRDKMTQNSINFIDKKDDYFPLYLSNISELNELVFKIYEFYKELKLPINYTVGEFQRKALEFFSMTDEGFRDFLKSDDYLSYKERCWQSYFALVIVMGYNTRWMNQLTEILICLNLLEVLFSLRALSLDKEKLNELVTATICMPEGLFPKAEDENEESKLKPYAIGDLQLVKQKFDRYELGEISEIVNVMKGEEKEIRNRTFTKNEESSEIKRLEINSQTIDDSDKQLNLAEEINRALDSKNRIEDYNDLKITYGPSNIMYSGTVTYTNPQSEEKDNSSFAKEIIHRAVSNINNTFSNIRRKIMTNEAEKVTISKIDNRNNINDYSGIYRWVNKVYKNYIVNYGTRLMYELFLEKPAKQFINANMLFRGENLRMPISPSTLGIKSREDITRLNFNDLRQHYNNLTPPKVEKIIISETLKDTESKLVEILNQYEAISVKVVVIASESIESQKIQMAVGSQLVKIDNNMGTSPLSKETGKISISSIEATSSGTNSSVKQFDEYSVNIEIECNLIGSSFEDWQFLVYKEILEDYRKQLQNYYKEIEEQFGENSKSKNIKIVKQSIMQGCKRTLYINYMSKNGIEINSENSSDLRVLQFIESLFEWNEMYFVFLENFIVNQDKDYGNSFNQFMLADYAHVILPVRFGFEMSALLFTDAGIIWNGRNSLCCCSSTISEDEGPLEIANEIKKASKHKDITTISEEWEVIIPTDMQMINESLLNNKI